MVTEFIGQMVGLMRVAVLTVVAVSTGMLAVSNSQTQSLSVREVECRSVGAHVNGEPVSIVRRARFHDGQLYLTGTIDSAPSPERVLSCTALEKGILCGRKFGPVTVTIMTNGNTMIETVADSQTSKELAGGAYVCDAVLKLPSDQQKKAMKPPPTAQKKVLSSGSGFFVSEGGHVVTNAHVVEDCRTVYASIGGILNKVSIDRESDLAIFISSEKPRAFAHVRGGRGPRIGETVVAVGFPLRGLLSSDAIVTTGTISALSGIKNDRREIQMTAPVQPGNSGGPLLGENGSVVGVVVGKLNAIGVAQATGDIPQNVNFAVGLGTLQSFLQ
jgi:S1-C subfamily serine protease